jgi:hypothetical protein
MSDFVKVPCKHCPFRADVKPFLTRERGEELAYSTENPYNSFPCHKTTDHVEHEDGSDMVVTEESKTCAGFLSMQITANGDEYKPEGFEVSNLVYQESYDMAEAYDEACDA